MDPKATQRPTDTTEERDAVASNQTSRCNIARFGGTCDPARGAAALAQDKTFDLKLSHWVPPTHPLQKAMEEWGASVEKASDGTIKSKVYPAQQLGKAFDHYDMARDGIADLTYINPGYQPGRFPIIARRRIAVPGQRTPRAASAALDAWYRKYAATEMKDVKFCFSFILRSADACIRSKKKIVVPADIKGMKVRPVARHLRGLDDAARRHQRAGAAPPKCATCMEKGVADAVTFPWGSMSLFGIDKVTKYHMERRST